MAKRIILNEEISSIEIPWDNGTEAYSGQAVEKFIKSQLSSKVGFMIIPQDKDTDGYYHLWGFANQAAYNDYMTDPESSADLRLLNVAIPLLEEHGSVSNIVTLKRKSAANIVTNKPIASIEVSYLWQQYNPITNETTDQDEDATIVVSCRTQNASGSWGVWDSGKEFSVNIQSGQTKVIDLSSLLTSDATYQVRLIATGEISGVSASPVTMTILYSNVSARYEGDIATAYKGSSIQLPFRVTGSVNKQLRIKINDYTKNFTLGTTTYTDNTFGATLNQNEFNLLRGSIKAEAWIAFGEGYSAETEHQKFQFIYIPEGDTLTTPILAITDIDEEFPNWTRATIFKYAIFNPVQEATLLNMTLQDVDTGQKYIQKSVECINGVNYSFEENFSMEYEGDDQPNIINAQMVFTNADGFAFGNNINFIIDNSENFAPTKGANVILSPENQQILIDGVKYNLEDLLFDLKDTNSGWFSNVEIDSTGTKINVPVLSIAAGNRLNLPYELFDENTGHNEGGIEGSITIEFDFKSKNIVANTEIIDASAPFSNAYTGLKFYPTRVVCLSRNNFTEDICDVHFQEETREHIAINIIRNLRGEGMNLVRIYVNGKSNRSFIYTEEDYFIPIGTAGARNIVIGSDDADIDIYGIRIYKGQQLGSTQIQNDYMASMPTIDDKKLFKRFNSIYNGTEIGYDLCNALGLNTILRRIPEGGHYPSRENQSKQKNVEIDVKIYTERGNPESIDMKHSGTFVGMTDKGQGTSAKGYYWWNISDNFEDDVEISAEDYDSTNPLHYTKNDTYFKKVSYFNSLDGVSQVYASDYEIEDGRSGITKLVGKCNYASSMQSHKLGGIWMYDELWQILVNNGSDGRYVFQDKHVCCYEKPFLCFYQIGNETPKFCGFQTWGSGKGDKKTFGYDKKKSPGFMCVSGADNGAIPALFQMPWVVSKNSDGAWKGNIYAKSVTINTGDIKNGYCYKSGSSDTLAFEVEIGSKYDGGETDKGVLRIEDEAKGETENTLFTTFAESANFFFSASPLLKPYAGTEADLIADSINLVRDHQYWLFNSTEDRYNVYYYNPAISKFEKIVQVPTAFGSDNRAIEYGSPKITEQLAGTIISINTVEGNKSMTLEEAMNTLGTSDMNVLNDCFVKARVAYFKAHADAYLDIPDIIYHQAFVKLEACTDNRAKNTYPYIDPSVDKRIRFFQDDLDTQKKTDNQGWQTKPYHVLEHTKDANGNNYWNGENNVLFTLIEMAYPERLRNMMRDMFTTMALIAGSVEQYIHDRYYWVQEYFPAVSYNETSRVLYEEAQVKLMNGLIDVSQDPITQAIGDQLECEKQFMNQRLPMLMSWCEYETGGDGTFSFRSVNNNQGDPPTYDIEYTAYQYIYPKMAIGGNMASLYAKVNGEWIDQGSEPYLCAPGESVRFVAKTDSNTQFTMRWMNYAQSIGNLGSLPCGENANVSISGKRLRKLECWAKDGEAIEFHPVGLTILNCRNLEEIDFTNASTFSGNFASELPRLRTLKLKGTSYTSVSLPKTSTLTELHLPSSINVINIEDQANLSKLVVDGLTNLRQLNIVGEHKLQSYTQTLVQIAYTEAKNLSAVNIDNILWSDFPVEMIMWLCSLGAQLTGSISLIGSITFNDKISLAAAYGNIDSVDNKLHLTYVTRTITGISIVGPSYITSAGQYKYDIICTPSNGNDIAITGENPDIEWTIDETAKIYGTFIDSAYGVLKVDKIDVSNTDKRYIAKCSLKKMTGTVLVSEMAISFYRRIPKIGDFAYADGTFDDQLLKNKTIVGLVYKIDEIWKGDDDSEPTVFVGYSKPDTDFIATRKLIGYQIRITCKEDVRYLTKDAYIDSKSAQWGLTRDDHSSIMSEIATVTGFTDSDILSIANITNSGLPNDNSGIGYVTTDSYLDSEQEDGFKDYSDGIGGVVDWNGVEKTKAIIRYANILIKSYLLSDNNESVNTNYIDDEGVSHELGDIPTTIDELSVAMKILKKGNNELGKYQEFLQPAGYGCYLYQPKVLEGEILDSQYKSGNWYLPAIGEYMRQFYFFAKSRSGGIGANDSVGAYTIPTRAIIDNMILSALNSSYNNEINLNVSMDSYESGEYSGSELNAINKYFHSLPEAEKPIYAMALWRTTIVKGGTPFTQFGTGQYWSSTEFDYRSAYFMSFWKGWAKARGNYPHEGHGKYNTNTVRPNVIYKFYL